MIENLKALAISAGRGVKIKLLQRCYNVILFPLSDINYTHLKRIYYKLDFIQTFKVIDTRSQLEEFFKKAVLKNFTNCHRKTPAMEPSLPSMMGGC